ncbi:MAG: sigma-70 family RNA polymerase sigma factor [Phycisphaerales bacterium]|nr:sigma-70 family RNA polymerase sigma factor [Phycisphaerales bacterium]
MIEAVAQPTTDPRSALLARAQAGDRAALDALWHEHRRWVAVVLLAHKPASADLEDLLQEVATILVARVGDVRDPACFKGWLRTVAINCARALARSASARPMLRLEDPRRSEANGGSPRQACHREADPSDRCHDEADQVLALSGRLPEEYREPLLLRSLNELSYRQIARLLELPETTVETRITRARRMLRELVETGTFSVAGTAPR